MDDPLAALHFLLPGNMRSITFLVLCMIFASATAFLGSFARLGDRAVCKLQMADVDLIFPGNKKCKAASGSSMKDGNHAADIS